MNPREQRTSISSIGQHSRDAATKARSDKIACTVAIVEKNRKKLEHNLISISSVRLHHVHSYQYCKGFRIHGLASSAALRVRVCVNFIICKNRNARNRVLCITAFVVVLKRTIRATMATILLERKLLIGIKAP